MCPCHSDLQPQSDSVCAAYEPGLQARTVTSASKKLRGERSVPDTRCVLGCQDTHSRAQQVGVVRQLIHRSKWAEIYENTARLLAMQEPTLQSFQRSLA